MVITGTRSMSESAMGQSILIRLVHQRLIHQLVWFPFWDLCVSSNIRRTVRSPKLLIFPIRPMHLNHRWLILHVEWLVPPTRSSSRPPTSERDSPWIIHNPTPAWSYVGVVDNLTFQSMLPIMTFPYLSNGPCVYTKFILGIQWNKDIMSLKLN